MEWTREARYRGLASISNDIFEAMKDQVNQSPWRQHYHIQPVTGLLNDPNGFIYFKGKYHLFYQWFPLGPVHGLKYWYHVESEDLIHFENKGPVIYPDTTYDSHGAYSGSSIQIDHHLYVFYTGNHRTKAWERIPNQMVAKLNDDIEVVAKQPIIEGVPQGYTEHFRDPKVWQEDEHYYFVIGAQTTEQTGRALIYQGDTSLNFHLLGEIDTGLSEFGYMWECPDLFKLDDKDVLIFCPQGIEPDGIHFQNIYQSGYIIGDFSLETLEMKHDGFMELDHGFDFYAPQTTLSKEGERVLIGWMGLPDINYPTDQYDWAHCLTLPRVLNIKDDTLIQKVHPDVEKLRVCSYEAICEVNQDSTMIDLIHPERSEVDISIVENEADELSVVFSNQSDEAVKISYEKYTGALMLDRSQSGTLPSNQDNQTRTVKLNQPLQSLRIFIDTSSMEIFINEGTHVMTTRLFPKAPYEHCMFSASGNVKIKTKQYELKRG
ncbi:glycoside hydrolase family 32 protein [Staphylococcus simulans]|uniref:glycoside hydrolase family 32 protein n=1 Tax=Staphylococcus simulans TaxID=1286 RepID=UPI00399AEBDE